MSTEHFDAVIIGAGLFGLFAALKIVERGGTTLVLELDQKPFSRATYINQARVHMGYHYPRSLTTALKSSRYFERFLEDYGFCIYKSFQQIYAISSTGSWTGSAQFEKFCHNVGIPCEEVPASRWFRPGLVDGAFLTREYTYDAKTLSDHLLRSLARFSGCVIRCADRVKTAPERDGGEWIIKTGKGLLRTPFVLNATYASVNQVNALFGFEPFGIKYELCEIILCDVPDKMKKVGLTVMDGPFFSIMPFGMTGQHSLTSVTFTPHETSHAELPSFACQRYEPSCSPLQLANCDTCQARPATAWPYMSSLARKYMQPELAPSFSHSLFSMKPILQASEVDDSRPTVVRVHSKSPGFVSVLSGKISTAYDLEEVLPCQM